MAPEMSRPTQRNAAGLALAALGYIAADYFLCGGNGAAWLPPAAADLVQPVLWGGLGVLCLTRAATYPHWLMEFRAAPKFVGCLLLMVAAIAVEVVMVQFVTVVLGLDWHRDTPPLPDTGQWILLALNDLLPAPVVVLLRLRLIELRHFLMLFVMLGFSVLFGCVRAPGLGLAARYCLTMAVGRTLRWVTFASTILPAVRPWCVAARFTATTAPHPHPWAQRYLLPYARNSDRLWQLLKTDSAFAKPPPYPPEFKPDWGYLQFFADLLRPLSPEQLQRQQELAGVPPEQQLRSSSWAIRPGGGCNDLAYSGHVLVAVLTACAWQEANPGWMSWLVWFLVLHSAQREIRERQHYSVDVVAALYVGVLLWKTVGPALWANPRPPRLRVQRRPSPHKPVQGPGPGRTISAWLLWAAREWLGAASGSADYTNAAAATDAAREAVAARLAAQIDELVKAAKDWDMERVRTAILLAAAGVPELGVEPESEAGVSGSARPGSEFLLDSGDKGGYSRGLPQLWPARGADDSGGQTASPVVIGIGVGIILITLSLAVLLFHLTVGG